ncbi:MAG TPA: dTDP-4-dehydrorhamnose reductase [Solirubrobacteraceae bacterium]|jgi:dTDP-4-dehydrorhamnose reductase|nr:dTDP-4-dehydrorhamnose reductase [Solirubrobacteraceae bacterium]
MRVLVAGAAGMLGLDVLRAGERAGHELVGLDLPELDITDAGAVQGAIERIAPDAVLNCAAWTDVDGAETHVEQAHAVNADGAGNLARAAAAAGVPLVHVSTDYVFSGEACVDSSGAPRAYVESDPTGPRSVYGQSKLAGEQQVLSASPAHTVVRSAWLFGVGGRNFAETMLRLAAEREAVQVVTDQVGCPTWTGHLAPALLGLIDRCVAGLVHLAGAGRVSWNGFTVEIFRQAEVDCRVEDATSAQMARPAPRPAWSVLESQREDVLPLPPWQDGLAGYLAARAGMMRA